ncbi:MAG: accessory factor UbiK family protein, partial [Gammaproteobacteria bacterium]|nr:accessory factor UbiK family protein [Gammaproteobacteria bacterium]
QLLNNCKNHGEKMFDPKMLDEVAQKLSSVLPSSLQAVQQDIEKNFKTVLQNAFSKMDLVSREEFDVQTSVLSRTRAKVDAMEKQLAELESLMTQTQEQQQKEKQQ